MKQRGVASEANLLSAGQIIVTEEDNIDEFRQQREREHYGQVLPKKLSANFISSYASTNTI